MFRSGRFNFYLAIVASGLLFAGCQSEKSKRDKEATMFQLHMETGPNAGRGSLMVNIGRTNQQFSIYVEMDSFIGGDYLDEANLIDSADGNFAIRLKFDTRGAMILQSKTSSNPGRRVAVECSFGKEEGQHRWIAAPIVRRPITDGIFIFTPQVTHEEAERIVRGLNNIAKQYRKDNSFLKDDSFP